ncbi:MAG TPA: sugar phosphate isomerase/epimerase family protein [Acidimicrobiales bacterium]|nr:sugar phosphate isomerase/epimerase family protein [Acidimicrobiales bacterium]
MAIGLSTYAFFWRWSAAGAGGLSLDGMLKATSELDVPVFQICDYPPIESMSGAQLQEVGTRAEDLGLSIELGTRGTSRAHLEHYLEIAGVLGASFVRTMVSAIDGERGRDREVELLCSVVPTYAQHGVTLGLETYEQVSINDLVAVVEGVNSPNLGICLDPGNCVARLEYPAQVIKRSAPYVVNMHIKDFKFVRQAGLVGFSLIGCPLGTGLLDYDFMINLVQPEDKGINQIVEQWVPPARSIEETCNVEDEWAKHSVAFLKNHSNPAARM